jgi:membrane associated rhomboid family serine protease
MRPASVGFHCPDDVKVAARTVRPARTVAGAPAATAEWPYVTGALVALNVVVYIVTAAGSHRGINDPQSSRLFHDWVLSPYAVAHGANGNGHDYYRLITSAFLHLNLTHLILNMIALAVVGPFVERVLGWWRYLAVYLLAALGGSVAVYWAPDHFNAVAGASGAIFGLFAAALVLAKRIGLDLRTLIAVVAINFFFTFTMSGISVEGHLGGFLLGGIAALGIVGWPTRGQRLSTRLQVVALIAVLVALVIMISIRTATFPVQ